MEKSSAVSLALSFMIVVEEEDDEEEEVVFLPSFVLRMERSSKPPLAAAEAEA